MQAYFSIDRFEGELVVLVPESDGMEELCLPRTVLPADAKEGQCLAQTETGEYLLDITHTKEKQAQGKARLAALLHRNKKIK